MPIQFKSYLDKPVPYAGGKSRILTDHPIHKLSSNENQLGTSAMVLDAIQENLPLIHEYPPRKDLELREALSHYCNNRLSPNQFFTSNGAVQAIEMILQGFLQEGNEVICSSPCFGPYLSFPKKYGGNVIDVPLIGDNFDLDVHGILNAITDRVRVLFITSPNNPTGTCPAKASLDLLLHNLSDHILVVYDEVYHHYVDHTDFVRGFELLDKRDSLITLNSFSKAHGLAGMRIAYGYSTERIATYLRNIPSPFAINTLSLKAAIASLSDYPFLESTVQMNRIGKTFLYDELDKLAIPYWKTQANFILLKPNIETKVFEQKMLDFDIMARPVKKFGIDGIRLTIGTQEQNELVVRAIKSILTK